VTEPYYSDDHVTLYCGDMRAILPTLGQFDAAICDPPYGVMGIEVDEALCERVVVERLAVPDLFGGAA
jgi:23S rRNA G2445 N2-methylase RlmL